MTRYQLPDTPEDRRRARRAHLVAGSVLAALFSGAMMFHRDTPGSGAPNPNLNVPALVVNEPEPPSADFGVRQ